MAARSQKPNDCQSVTASYANYFEVGHNAFEFLIDFGQIDPCTGQFNIGNRIAVGPTHAKLFSRLLASAVNQYEMQFEPIPEIHGDDLLECALDTSPDFEQRALDARRRKSRSTKRK